MATGIHPMRTTLSRPPCPRAFVNVDRTICWFFASEATCPRVHVESQIFKGSYTIMIVVPGDSHTYMCRNTWTTWTRGLTTYSVEVLSVHDQKWNVDNVDRGCDKLHVGSPNGSYNHALYPLGSAATMATRVLAATGTVIINGVTIGEFKDLVLDITPSQSVVRATKNSLDTLRVQPRNCSYEQLAEQWLQRLHPAEHSAVLLSHGWINEVWRNTLNRWQEDLAMRINRKARQLGFILTRDWIEIRSKRLDLLRSEPEVVEVPFDKYPALHARAMRETRGTYQRVLAANRSTWNHGGTRHGYSRCALIERLNKQGYHVINYRGEKRLAWKSLSGTFYTWVPS